MLLKACDMSKNKDEIIQNRLYHSGIPFDYSPIESLSVNIKFMPKHFNDFKYLLWLLAKLSILCFQYQSNQGHHKL